MTDLDPHKYDRVAELLRKSQDELLHNGGLLTPGERIELSAHLLAMFGPPSEPGAAPVPSRLKAASRTEEVAARRLIRWAHRRPDSRFRLARIAAGNEVRRWANRHRLLLEAVGEVLTG